MVRWSNAVVCFVNILTLLIGTALICGFTLKSSGKECLHGMQWTFTCIGVFMLILSMLGIFGSCCRFNYFLGIYIFLLFLMMFIVISAITWTFMNTSKVTNGNAPEYKLVVSSSSSWIQKKIIRNWKGMEKCIRETKLCSDQVMEVLVKINNTNTKDTIELAELYNTLTPTEIGCCKPPSECGFTYVNASSWEAPAGSKVPWTDEDCKEWSSRGDKMCYGCDSCKAGVIVSSSRSMRETVWADIVLLLCIDIVYVIAYQAFRNNEADRS